MEHISLFCCDGAHNAVFLLVGWLVFVLLIRLTHFLAVSCLIHLAVLYCVSELFVILHEYQYFAARWCRSISCQSHNSSENIQNISFYDEVWCMSQLNVYLHNVILQHYVNAPCFWSCTCVRFVRLWKKVTNFPGHYILLPYICGAVSRWLSG